MIIKGAGAFFVFVHGRDATEGADLTRWFGNVLYVLGFRS
jgi:hypothetical protein